MGASIFYVCTEADGVEFRKICSIYGVQTREGVEIMPLLRTYHMDEPYAVDDVTRLKLAGLSTCITIVGCLGEFFGWQGALEF